MEPDDLKRYTMQVGEVSQLLDCSRETVHNLAETGELSYRVRSRGKQEWKFFDPQEVAQLAQKRGVEQKM